MIFSVALGSASAAATAGQRPVRTAAFAGAGLLTYATNWFGLDVRISASRVWSVETIGWKSMDRLASMAVFVKAADLGSFTAAAAALGMSSQMVGKHVSFLEQRLGAPLLHRTTRQQSLTTIGEAFYARCRTIIADAEAAEMLVHDLSTTPRGRLRVNAPISFGAVCIAPLVGRYLQAHPHMDVELTLSDRYVDLVDEGYDVVFRIGALKDSSLAARALPTYRLLACASPAYLAEHGVPTTPEDLVSHQCLGYVTWSGLAYLEWPFERDGLARSIQIHPRFQVNDGRVLLAAALDGIGIILQPEPLVANAVSSGALVHILGNYTSLSRPMHMLFSAKRPQLPKLRTFIDFVTGALPLA